jgi:hypothetical protein
VLQQARSRWIEVAGPHGARVQAVSVGMQLVLPGIFYALQLAFTDMIAVLHPERPALRRSGQLTTGMRGRLFRMMFGWWLAGMVLSVGTTFTIEALTPPVPFEQVDTNGDNVISADEAEGVPAVESRLRSMDKDRDGALSAAEYQAWLEDPAHDVTTIEGASTRFFEMVFDPTSVGALENIVSEVIWAVLAWLLTLALLVLYVEREDQVKAKRALKTLEGPDPSPAR